MKSLFDSLWATIAMGIVLAVILYYCAQALVAHAGAA
jgi:hypothetical protein